MTCRKPVRLRGQEIEISRILLETDAIRIFQSGHTSEFCSDGPYPAARGAKTG
jgi:hypothetical protein